MTSTLPHLGSRDLSGLHMGLHDTSSSSLGLPYTGVVSPKVMQPWHHIHSPFLFFHFNNFFVIIILQIIISILQIVYGTLFAFHNNLFSHCYLHNYKVFRQKLPKMDPISFEFHEKIRNLQEPKSIISICYERSHRYFKLNLWNKEFFIRQNTVLLFVGDLIDQQTSKRWKQRWGVW